MLSTITLVVPCVEKESVFLQLAIQAHRDHPKSYEVKEGTVNNDRSGEFSLPL